MILFRDTKLAHELSQNLVTQRQQWIYFILMGLLLTSYLYLYITDILLNETDNYIYRAISSIMGLIILALSFILSYKINISGDNANYFKRYFSLSIPIFVKIFIYTLPIVLIGFFIDFFISDFYQRLMQIDPNSEEFEALVIEGLENLSYGLFSTLSYILIHILTLWRYITCFRIASGQAEYKK